MITTGVHFIRLITGEALMAKVEAVSHVHDGNGNTKNGSAVLSNPAQITMQSDEAGRVKLGMVDFLPFADKQEKTITIDLQHIIYVHIPTVNMANQYSATFGSGLIVPAGPGLRSV